MTCGIYRIVNKINGKCYVGQSTNINRRWACHRDVLNSGRGRNAHFQYAWNKYGGDSFIFEVLEECQENVLKERELFWIEYYHALDVEFGYNLMSPTHPLRHSEVSREKMSLAKKGKYLGENNHNYGKRGVLSPNYGKHLSEETKRKLSAALSGEKHYLYGKHPSECTKKRMSEAQRGERGHNYGKRLSVETKKQISESKIGIQAGENNPKAKLSWKDVSEIRRKYSSGGISLYQLGLEYNTTKANVWKIIKNKIWNIE